MYYMLLVKMRGEMTPTFFTDAGQPWCLTERGIARLLAGEILAGEGFLGDLFEAYKPWPGVEYVKLVECREVEPAIYK